MTTQRQEKALLVTRGIKNCRDVGYSSGVARFNFCVT